ncbi:MAG: ATP-binding cassette domain-containing protein [Acutalibacteraceae bacterium]
MLIIDNVTKKFNGNKKVLNGVSFKFDSGVYGLLGPNGSGKTTLMRCILGLYPYSGTIELNGSTIKNNKKTASKIGYLPQSFGLFRDLTVYEVMDYFAVQKNLLGKDAKDEIAKALEAVNLSDRTESKCKKLSGGMIRRVGIAQALLGKPDLIMFDEPTAGLDPEERLRFKNIISSISKDTTVVISTHIVEDIESVCEKVVVFNKGSIIKGDSIQNIRSAAEGKVFIVPENQGFNKNAFVVREYLQDDKTVKRVLSNEACGTLVTPTVEDGYLCLLKDI